MCSRDDCVKGGEVCRHRRLRIVHSKPTRRGVHNRLEKLFFDGICHPSFDKSRDDARVPVMRWLEFSAELWLESVENFDYLCLCCEKVVCVIKSVYHVAYYVVVPLVFAETFTDR